MKNAALPPGKTTFHFYPTATPNLQNSGKTVYSPQQGNIGKLLTRERGVKLIFLSAHADHELNHRLASRSGLDCANLHRVA